MHPQEVTALLKEDPTSITVVGSPWRGDGPGKGHVARLTLWLLDSEGIIVSKDLRHHLDWIIGRVGPRRDVLSPLQQSSDVKMDVLCSQWSMHGDGVKPCGGRNAWARPAKLGDVDKSCILWYRTG